MTPKCALFPVGRKVGLVAVSNETRTERAERILRLLRSSYPGKRCYDIDGRGMHFVCEVEPAAEHPGYDKAVEVIISSTPHKHKQTTQRYKVLSGTLELHVDDASILLRQGDAYTVRPEAAHWATSDDEAVVEICSKPGWTPEDHLRVSQPERTST
jgi:mannose-6-phosphate isomerase-like protein (cupin superfamily)